MDDDEFGNEDSFGFGDDPDAAAFGSLDLTSAANAAELSRWAPFRKCATPASGPRACCPGGWAAVSNPSITNVLMHLCLTRLLLFD